MRDIPLSNLSYGLLVEVGDGSKGSGYLVNTRHSSYFVTAKHVLFDENNTLRSHSATLNAYSANLEHCDRATISLSLDILSVNKCILSSEAVDIVVIHIARRNNDNSINFKKGASLAQAPKGRLIGVAYDNMIKLKKVLIANSVYITGYPSSIGLPNIPQIDYEMPLVRSGVVAGKNNKLNTIILDCEVYPGNSGGPVIQKSVGRTGTYYNLIGTISQYIPFHLANIQRDNKTVNNSGYSVVVPCDPVLELIDNHNT